MKVLIVEDDRSAAEILKQHFISDSHTVDVALDGADGSFLGRSYAYDAIVLDQSLPKKNGLAVCREIRAAGRSTPIVFLSVHGDMGTKLSAFKEGADDYLVKPFSLLELDARVGAVTRRPAGRASSTMTVDTLSLDTETKTVTRNGSPIHLTRKEYGLLEYFMSHPGAILSRASLIEHVWTADSDPLSNSVEAHIRNLRRKIMCGDSPNLIINIPGRGYVIDTPENLEKF